MQDIREAKALKAMLNDFDPNTRRAALRDPALRRSATAGSVTTNVNMHFHSFFSYNAEGYSPSRISWESRKSGLYAAALCDFDVLDGLEEFLEAGRILGLRSAVHLETRAFLRDYADVDISSPGEPGVTYVMGAGFAREPAPGSVGGRGLTGTRRRAGERNVALVNRINSRLPRIAIDYERDVLPLTPSGAATERHIVTAYINQSRACFGNSRELAAFWSDVLGQSVSETAGLLEDPPRLEELVRAKLAKRGGLGYETPSGETFPPVEEFMSWVLACEAIPMITWLDGTSAGEADGRALLECMIAKGGAALNIIPDRNWNVADQAMRSIKRDKLSEIVRIADDLGLPINVGTEMNRLGLPFVDDLDVGCLRHYKESFLRGARIMVGHTLLLRYAGLSYVGDRTEAEFGGVVEKNAFFERVGGMPPVDEEQAGRLEDMGAEKALAWFYDKAGKTGR